MLIPYGYCHCGCGQKTTLHKTNDVYYGYLCGEPHKFIVGHNNKGCNNPSWNGGQTVSSGGYLMLRKPAHSRANNGYVFEHILKAEAVLGKSLPEKAEVHHYKKQLIICQDHAYHFLLHQRQRAYEACGHASWRKCRFCKQYDKPENLYINGKNANHVTCHKEYNTSRIKRTFDDKELQELINSSEAKN